MFYIVIPALHETLALGNQLEVVGGNDEEGVAIRARGVVFIAEAEEFGCKARQVSLWNTVENVEILMLSRENAFAFDISFVFDIGETARMMVKDIGRAAGPQGRQDDTDDPGGLFLVCQVRVLDHRHFGEEDMTMVTGSTSTHPSSDP